MVQQPPVLPVGLSVCPRTHKHAEEEGSRGDDGHVRADVLNGRLYRREARKSRSKGIFLGIIKVQSEVAVFV